MKLTEKNIDKLHKQFKALETKPDTSAAVMPEGDDNWARAQGYWETFRPIILSLKSVLWIVGIFGKNGKKKCLEIVNGTIAFFDQFFSGQDIMESKSK